MYIVQSKMEWASMRNFGTQVSLFSVSVLSNSSKTEDPDVLTASDYNNDSIPFFLLIIVLSFFVSLVYFVPCQCSRSLGVFFPQTLYTTLSETFLCNRTKAILCILKTILSAVYIAHYILLLTFGRSYE